MTDQDWEVDGASGDSAGAGVGEAASGSAPVRTAPANVVPFPGHWFGSVDELIPVHPPSPERRPDPPERRPDPPERRPDPPERRPDPPASRDEPRATSVADASDFWEGDAATLEEVSAPVESQAAIALLRSPGATKRKPQLPAEPDADASGVETALESPSRRAGWRSLSVALGLLAVGAVLLVTYVLPGRLSQGPSRHRVHLKRDAVAQKAPAVTHTVTSEVTVTTAAARSHRRRPAKRTTQTTRGSAASRVTGATVSAPTVNAAAPNSAASVPSRSASSSSSSSSSLSRTGCAAQSPDSGCMP